MRHAGTIALAWLCAIGCAGSTAVGDDTILVDVKVSPNTIVLGLDKGAAITVHTDISLGIVNRATVALSGIPAALTFADARGNLVAKFRQELVEAIIAPPEAILVLTGTTHDGTAFWGEDSVRVIDDPSTRFAPQIAAEAVNVSLAPEVIEVATRLAGPGNAPQLSAVETEHILFMREEEKLARDVYLAMSDLWDMPIFAHISQSEQRHMDAIGTLIEVYGLVDPVVDDTPGVFTNADLGNLYVQLVAQGSASELDALVVGAFIEDLDIVDLRDALADAVRRNVEMVFTNLEAASCNHLRAFVQTIEFLGGSYTPQFLTADEFDEIIHSRGRLEHGSQLREERRTALQYAGGEG